ncbi:MAG: DUF4290 domain-containing protein [Bacteroidales bacterium]|jgi:hypothetical protein|nr:DUF4290 domain-containing protein [Bacteroidales bacterium]HOA09883.1 DUF4290 domain-containing protein [Tenuifilaceae bacterium]MBP8643751.1 DUF4290 domain-containing protein [Bacteroidales bacterium]HOC36757.1 DUF4290 domain-containing protein [Tenuifilaceae bacterium]HOW21323.1 DUF4290 domain-containing protein [Tenuifilaceae bacterium]
MDYNTQRKKLALPEYGRHIQQMVDYIASVEDRDERNRLAKSLVAIMGNLNPHLRDINDFKHKLWDHLFIMSDFKLDIDSPYPIPSVEQYNEKPRRVPYPGNPIKFKHYGRIIEMMIEKAVAMEEGPEKDALKQLIANQMKKANITWNKESVSDDDIFRDMQTLSNGMLVMAPGSKLVDNKEFKNKPRTKYHKKH